MTRSHSATGVECSTVAVWSPEMPALLTSTSMRPSFATAAATNSSTDASSATSRAAAYPSGPAYLGCAVRVEVADGEDEPVGEQPAARRLPDARRASGHEGDPAIGRHDASTRRAALSAAMRIGS